MNTILIVEYLSNGRYHLSYGRFDTESEYSHTELTRGYSIYGNPIDTKRKADSYHRVLRMGDGIKTFETYWDMMSFINQAFTHRYKLFSEDLVHRKFYIDRDTLLEFSRQ